MTAVLQLLQDIARHLDVQTTVTPEQLRDLMKKTDLQRLTNRMDLNSPGARGPGLAIDLDGTNPTPNSLCAGEFPAPGRNRGVIPRSHRGQRLHGVGSPIA